jgi:hypothetical protein
MVYVFNLHGRTRPKTMNYFFRSPTPLREASHHGQHVCCFSKRRQQARAGTIAAPDHTHGGDDEC